MSKKSRRKRKKIKYKKKQYNLDTLSINAIQTSGVLGIHVPEDIDITRLNIAGRKNRIS